uniref:Uncharacterized protein n=1 Tax=Anguilla anguilla TaxID=7936 RepID=A0A0E9T024_ANGAN
MFVYLFIITIVYAVLSVLSPYRGQLYLLLFYSLKNSFDFSVFVKGRRDDYNILQLYQ